MKFERFRDISLNFTRRHDNLTFQYQWLQRLPQSKASGIFFNDPCNDATPLGDQYIIALLNQADVTAQVIFQLLDACGYHYLTLPHGSHLCSRVATINSLVKRDLNRPSTFLGIDKADYLHAPNNGQYPPIG
jgi:hypothetical protein